MCSCAIFFPLLPPVPKWRGCWRRDSRTRRVSSRKEPWTTPSSGPICSMLCKTRTHQSFRGKSHRKGRWFFVIESRPVPAVVVAQGLWRKTKSRLWRTWWCHPRAVWMTSTKAWTLTPWTLIWWGICCAALWFIQFIVQGKSSECLSR